MKNILIAAGEVSGDMHGAFLVQKLKALSPELTFYGLGGHKMQAAGVEIITDLTAYGTIGFAEVLHFFIPVYRTFLAIKQLIKKRPPDLIICIDYQGFNVLLARNAKSQKIPVIYYIAPQEWIWGSSHGAAEVLRNVTRLLTIFQKEDRFYRTVGQNVDFIGHPLLDIVKPLYSAKDYRNKHQPINDGHMVTILPGSRTQEITRLFPIMLETIRILNSRFPGTVYLLPVSSPVFEQNIVNLITQSGLEIILIPYEERYDALQSSDVAIAVSGTVTLEATILEIPMVTFYQLSPLSYFWAKHFMKIRLSHISLPNIVAGLQVLPEFVQMRARPDLIADEASALLQDPDRRQRMRNNLQTVKRKLGTPGAIERAARIILEQLEINTR